MAKNDKQVKKNKDDSLTLAQETFVQELIKGLTQRKAYLVAYPNRKHWKDKTIDEEACKLLKKTKVNTRYTQLKQRIVKETEEETITTVKDILKELKKVGFANINDYVEYETKEQIVLGQFGPVEIMGEDGGKQYLKEKVSVVTVKNSSEVDGSAIQEISSVKGSIKVKTYDKVKALTKMLDYLTIKQDEEKEGTKDDGLTKQIEKIANSDIWEGFEDDEDCK